MRAVVHVAVPKDAEVSIKMTMTMEEARTLLHNIENGLHSHWPNNDFKDILRGILGDITAQADAHKIIGG